METWKLFSQSLTQTFKAASRSNQTYLKDAISVFEFVRNCHCSYSKYISKFMIKPRRDKVFLMGIFSYTQTVGVQNKTK